MAVNNTVNGTNMQLQHTNSHPMTMRPALTTDLNDSSRRTDGSLGFSE